MTTGTTTSRRASERALEFEARPHPGRRTRSEREAVLEDPGFGLNFTDHMAVATWTLADGWHDSAIVPYGPFALDPATAVLHYSQSVFEGLKAYRHGDGSVWLFRPEKNAERFARSAHRLALPELSTDDFLASLESLVGIDRNWVPEGGEKSLYLRPFLFASEAFLGVRPAHRVTYCVIASPAGAYFASGVRPVSIWVTTTYTRAAIGGTGEAKCGGNYASSLIAQQEAAQHGCDQVMFTDATERAYLEELGGMNLYLVTRDNELVTPELSGSILEGVTRDSILALAADFGLTPVERRIKLTEVLEGIGSGHVTEMFACGTAAVITPIAQLKDHSQTYTVNAGETGEVTAALRKTLLDIQHGRAEDRYGWLRRIV